MSTPIKEIEMEMAYAESLLGCALQIETSSSSYGTTDARDGLNTNSSVLTRLKAKPGQVTGQTLSQMGTREQKVSPHVKTLTG
jgi:hypothetical protein